MAAPQPTPWRGDEEERLPHSMRFGLRRPCRLEMSPIKPPFETLSARVVTVTTAMVDPVGRISSIVKAVGWTRSRVSASLSPAAIQTIVAGKLPARVWTAISPARLLRP